MILFLVGLIFFFLMSFVVVIFAVFARIVMLFFMIRMVLLVFFRLRLCFGFLVMLMNYVILVSHCFLLFQCDIIYYFSIVSIMNDLIWFNFNWVRFEFRLGRSLLQLLLPGLHWLRIFLFSFSLSLGNISRTLAHLFFSLFYWHFHRCLNKIISGRASLHSHF